MKKEIFAVIAAAAVLFSGCTARLDIEKDSAKAKVNIEEEKITTLSERTFSVPDADNLNGLSEKRIEHSYGVSKNGVPNEISLDFQKYFDDNGFKAICCGYNSGEKSLYLTFDCGYENGCTSAILDTLKEKIVPAAFFCTLDHIKDAPELIERMINEGHIVGNHSTKHPDFSKLTREQMAKEILDCDNYLRTNFNYTAPFFRFPEGAYNESALDLVGSMGYTSVFWSCSYEDWDTENQKGGDYAFEKVTSRLHPGAIILLHAVSQDNKAALGRIIDYARENGYEFKPLTEFHG